MYAHCGRVLSKNVFKEEKKRKDKSRLKLYRISLSLVPGEEAPR